MRPYSGPGAGAAVRRVAPFLVLLAAWAALGPSTAWAHGGLESSTPAEDADLRRPPTEVRITLSEAPAPGSSLQVTEGCGRDATAGEARAKEDELSVPLSEGQPGRWKVRYRVLSAVDGHVTRGSFSFDVDGTKDCAAAEIDRGPRVRNPNPPEEGSTFPIVPVVGGTLVIGGLALIVRRAATK